MLIQFHESGHKKGPFVRPLLSLDKPLSFVPKKRPFNNGGGDGEKQKPVWRCHVVKMEFPQNAAEIRILDLYVTL